MERIPVRTDDRFYRRIELPVEFVEVLGPVRQAAGAKPFNSPTVSVFLDHPPRGEHVVLRARADKGERCGTERELEQAPSKRRDVIVVPFGRGISDNIDLPIGESEPPVHLTARSIFRFRVGQIELGRTRLENYISMRRVGDLCETLRRQHDGGVLLAQGAQPLLDLRAKDAVGEHDPCFIEHDQRRSAVEPLIDAMDRYVATGTTTFGPIAISVSSSKVTNRPSSSTSRSESRKRPSGPASENASSPSRTTLSWTWVTRLLMVRCSAGPSATSVSACHKALRWFGTSRTPWSSSQSSSRPCSFIRSVSSSMRASG